ncbi:Orf y [Tanacetum coccineum]|uniref:RNA-directed DNA polymerase n=1 Tax=Tanacetum coccineum TaxID=301880 RepID=A0ABQ5ECY0_9ASTR
MARNRHQVARTTRRVFGRNNYNRTLETAVDPERQLEISRERRANLVPAEVLYSNNRSTARHRVYEHYSEQRILCVGENQINLRLCNEESYESLRNSGLQHIHLGIFMIRLHALHRRSAGTNALVVLRDTRWEDSRQIIATMEVDLSAGTQLVYTFPDMILSVNDFHNHVEVAIQTHGYDTWQGESNLLITIALTGRLSNTSYMGFQYNMENVVDHLTTTGITATPGERKEYRQTPQPPRYSVDQHDREVIRNDNLDEDEEHFIGICLQTPQEEHISYDVCFCESCLNEARILEEEPLNKVRRSNKPKRSRQRSWERWSTLGEPSGKWDYYVKYDAPPDTTPIEEIAATGWGDEFSDDEVTPGKVTILEERSDWDDDERSGGKVLVIQERLAQNQQEFLDEYLPQWDEHLAIQKQELESEWENPFAAKRGENHTILHLSKEEENDDLPYPKFRNFKQVAAQIIKKHEEHAFPSTSQEESTQSYQPPHDSIMGPSVYPPAQQNPQPFYRPDYQFGYPQGKGKTFSGGYGEYYNSQWTLPPAWTESRVMLVLPADPSLRSLPAIKFTHTFVSKMCKDAALAKELRDLSLCSAIPIPGYYKNNRNKNYLGKTVNVKRKQPQKPEEEKDFNSNEVKLLKELLKEKTEQVQQMIRDQAKEYYENKAAMQKKEEIWQSKESLLVRDLTDALKIIDQLRIEKERLEEQKDEEIRELKAQLQKKEEEAEAQFSREEFPPLGNTHVARPCIETEVHYSGNATTSPKIRKITNQLYNVKVEFDIPNCTAFGTTAIIDTGASACCINKKVIPKEALEPLTQTVVFNGLNSRQQATHRIKQGYFLIEENKFKIPLIYAFDMRDNNGIEMLIGANFLRSMKGGIRIEGDEITIYKKVTKIKTSNQTEIAEIAELEVSEEEFLEINESIYFNQEGSRAFQEQFKPVIDRLKQQGYIGEEPLKHWKKNGELCKLDIINPDITIEDRPLKHVTPAMEDLFRKHVDSLSNLISPKKSRQRTMRLIENQGTTIDPVTGREVKGKERMVFNYKSLNDNTYKDQYSLPGINTIIKRIGGAKIFSKFDLKSGFHQVAMDEESIPWTTFLVTGGLHEWLVMPFGLKNAPAVFQRKMDKCFKGTESFIAVYIDDILVFSKNEKDHAKHLERMLKICEDNGLVLSPTKMKIAVSTVDFLGAVIGEGTIKLQPHIIKKIVNFNEEELKTKKGLRSFLGILNYARNHIPKLGILLRPLYEKTNAHGDKRLKPSDYELVRKIKEQVQNLPDLEIPPENAHIILETDGCMEGWGGIVKWKKSKEDPRSSERICAYASGKFSTTQSTIDAEINACINTLEKLKIYYLDKQEVTLRTDCQAIISFYNKTNSNKSSRVRWIKFADAVTGTGVKINIEHIEGKHNTLADSLSRLVNLSFAECTREIKELTAASLYFVEEVLQSPNAFQKNMKTTCEELKANQTLIRMDKFDAWRSVAQDLELAEAKEAVKAMRNLQVIIQYKAQICFGQSTKDNHWKGFLEDDESSDDSILIVDPGWDDYCLQELKLNNPFHFVQKLKGPVALKNYKSISEKQKELESRVQNCQEKLESCEELLRKTQSETRKSLQQISTEIQQSKPLTKREVLNLVQEITEQPKLVEKEALRLTEDLNKKIQNVEHLLHEVKKLITG